MQDKFLKSRGLPERDHGLAHGVQPQEKKSEAKNNLSVMLAALAFRVKHQQGSCRNAERSDSGHIKSDQDTGDGRTDIGAEDNAGRLRQIHNSGVDEAHDHDGRRSRRLDYNCNQHTDQEADDRSSGQLLKKIFHSGSGSQFQAFSHIVHAEQESTKSAEQCNDVVSSHVSSTPSSGKYVIRTVYCARPMQKTINQTATIRPPSRVPALLMA